MNLTLLRTRSCLSALAGILPLGGCASQRDLVAAGRITLEPRIDHTLRKPPDVYEADEDLVVAGRLERGLPRDVSGRIDVTVILPDGATVYDVQVNYCAETVSDAGTRKPLHGSFRRAHALRKLWGLLRLIPRAAARRLRGHGQA